MTLEELITAFRTRTRDTVPNPYLWSDDEVTSFFNEAENEACERARLILDIDNPEVCQIPIESGVATYDLDPRILHIQRAKLDLGSRPLLETSLEELDAQTPGWESRSAVPDRFFQTAETSLTLVGTPVADDVLRLRVYRLPLKPLKAGKDKPEIAERHHARLIDWALRCGYLKKDAETFDEEKAAKHQELFAQSFGERPDANVQRKHRDRRPPIVRMATW